MNNKGFTLVEVLGVIVLLTVIVTIAVPSIIGVSNKIKKDMYDAKIDVILADAKLYGQDHYNFIFNSSNKCIPITVGDLLKEGYLTPDKDDTKETIISPIDNSSMNSIKISLYIKNNRVVAALEENYNCSNPNQDLATDPSNPSNPTDPSDSNPGGSSGTNPTEPGYTGEEPDPDCCMKYCNAKNECAKMSSSLVTVSGKHTGNSIDFPINYYHSSSGCEITIEESETTYNCPDFNVLGSVEVQTESCNPWELNASGDERGYICDYSLGVLPNCLSIQNSCSENCSC